LGLYENPPAVDMQASVGRLAGSAGVIPKIGPNSTTRELGTRLDRRVPASHYPSTSDIDGGLLVPTATCPIPADDQIRIDELEIYGTHVKKQYAGQQEYRKVLLTEHRCEVAEIDPRRLRAPIALSSSRPVDHERD